MASDLKLEDLQSTLKVQERMGDAHSKDLEHSNNTHQEISEDKTSSPTVLEDCSLNFPIPLDTSSNEPANLMKPPPDDSVSTSEKNLHVVASFSYESADILVENSTKKQTVASAENSNEHLSKETNAIKPSLSVKKELTEVIHLVFSEESRSTDILQPALFKETGSSKIIHAALAEVMESNQCVFSEDSESNEVIQPFLDVETESNEVIHTDSDAETESNEVIQTYSDSETESNEVIQMETESNEVIQTETESNEVIQTETESNEVIQTETESNEVIQPAVYEESESSFPPALDLESFYSLLNSKEYENGTLIHIPGKGKVIVNPTPTTPCKSYFADFVIPPSPPVAKNPVESIKPLNSTTDKMVTNNINSKRSLSTLSSMIVDWLQRGLQNYFNTFEQHKTVDFINYSKKELEYVICLLTQIKERIDTLLNAADGLPNPPYIFPLEIEKISVRNSIKSAGVAIQRKLGELEADTIENCNRFDLISYNATKLDTEKCDIVKTAREAQEMLRNSFVKISQDFLTLSIEIQDFRMQIRDLCLEIESCL